MNRQFISGRRRSLFDHRDFIIKNQTGAVNTKKEWPIQITLDQGSTPHCGGFAMAGFGNCAPVMDKMYDDKGHDFYYLCKEVENEPGMENGVYTSSMAKVLKAEGIIPGYGWLLSIEDAKQWVLKFGPILVGTVWMSSMVDIFETDGTMVVYGREVGGHAYLMTGYDRDTDKFSFINSWGIEWGLNGHFKIRANDFERLLKAGGEMIAAVEKTSPMVNW